jgi:hypothetical protein
VLRPEICLHRQENGRCQRSDEPCRLAEFSIADWQLPIGEISGQTKEILAELRRRRDFIDGQIREHQKVLGFHSPAGDEKYRSTTIFYHSIGNFHYLTGMEDVWLGGRHYDLREHKRARLCLICMAEANAVDEKSALHFLEQIDPHVRAQGKIDPLGKYSNIKIQDYFRDPTNEITSLGQLLIKAVGGNGKYYLNPDVG